MEKHYFSLDIDDFIPDTGTPSSEHLSMELALFDVGTSG
jgi:hypothetical protein